MQCSHAQDKFCIHKNNLNRIGVNNALGSGCIDFPEFATNDIAKKVKDCDQKMYLMLVHRVFDMTVPYILI